MKLSKVWLLLWLHGWTPGNFPFPNFFFAGQSGGDWLQHLDGLCRGHWYPPSRATSGVDHQRGSSANTDLAPYGDWLFHRVSSRRMQYCQSHLRLAVYERVRISQKILFYPCSNKYCCVRLKLNLLLLNLTRPINFGKLLLYGFILTYFHKKIT